MPEAGDMKTQQESKAHEAGSMTETGTTGLTPSSLLLVYVGLFHSFFSLFFHLQLLDLGSGESHRNGSSHNKTHSTDALSCKNAGQSSLLGLSACFI